MLTRTLFKAIAPEDAEPGDGAAERFSRHFLSLSSTKIADGLIDPKLVLAWVMGAVGAPGYLIGSLVPVREAGALLPQILLAREIQRRAVRKYFWVAGSIIQGLAAFGMAIAALTLEGAGAGWVILLCLAIFACARAACSASHKDVLARTVETGARGTVSGAAGTVAALVVFAFAVLLSFGVIPRELGAISIAIMVAGALWLLAAMTYLGIDEPPDRDAGDEGTTSKNVLEPLWKDGEFRRYILVRGLMISTALAPPFLVMLSEGAGEGAPGNLGLLLVASSLAAIASSYLWGRLSDRSSRQTLAGAGALAAIALGTAAAIGLMTGGLLNGAIAAVAVFVAQIGYEGARAGRKTHLTDMDTPGGKARYTALSNTMIGVLLIAGGGFGFLSDIVGPSAVLALFAVMSLLGAWAALGLDEVQGDSGARAG
ncbi:MFS transporter [Ovoidimarina sediminis]|uniref:MFS transporter n=1 Tax=Ovoidimarina sediminis TaxID=3079856 RepID=UPI00291496A1|nr:MFS transporter [Rhodophyticola sp. MJ-SS7]MDU8945409.1 MFS transporter [Rhodophyticola sp. MJ-SS7]